MIRLLRAAALLGAFALLLVPASGQDRKERIKRLALAREFKKLDTNNNGKLSMAEFAKWGPVQRLKEKKGKGAVLLLFRKMDTNKNGSLSREEFVNGAMKLAELRQKSKAGGTKDKKDK
jgi:Ca2+-binding EF-hand superfamily protein